MYTPMKEPRDTLFWRRVTVKDAVVGSSLFVIVDLFLVYLNQVLNDIQDIGGLPADLQNHVTLM